MGDLPSAVPAQILAVMRLISNSMLSPIPMHSAPYVIVLAAAAWAMAAVFTPILRKIWNLVHLFLNMCMRTFRVLTARCAPALVAVPSSLATLTAVILCWTLKCAAATAAMGCEATTTDFFTEIMNPMSFSSMLHMKSTAAAQRPAAPTMSPLVSMVRSST